MVTILFESIVVCGCACVPFVSFKSVLSCFASLYFHCQGFFFSHTRLTLFFYTQKHFCCKISISISSNSNHLNTFPFRFGILYVCSHLIRPKRRRRKPNEIVHTYHIRFVPTAIFVNFLSFT